MSVSYKHRSSHFLHLYIVNYIIGLDDVIFDKLPDLSGAPCPTSRIPHLKNQFQVRTPCENNKLDNFKILYLEVIKLVVFTLSSCCPTYNFPSCKNHFPRESGEDVNNVAENYGKGFAFKNTLTGHVM